METQPLDRIDNQPAGETPEDVAILYSWANLEGAKYRDFSANRREYRAQMRHRAAEQLRLMELRAQSEAEAAAAEAEAEAAAAHAEADAASVKLAASRTLQDSTDPATPEDEHVEHMRKSSLREAAQQARRAAAERLEAARRAEAAALADSIARREEREIAEAQASALRQAAQYAEADIRSRQKKNAQPENVVPGRMSDPYGPQMIAEGEYFERPGTPVAELEASRFRQQREFIEQSTGTELPQFRMPAVSESVGKSATPVDREQLPATIDESLTGHAVVEMPSDFGPRRHSKPLYEERNLPLAPAANRLDEAGASRVRPEEKRAEHATPDVSELERRVVVPSIPYREFRRTTVGKEVSTAEVVNRLPGLAAQKEADSLRADESLVGTGRSQLSSGQPDGGNQPNSSEIGRERWTTAAGLSVLSTATFEPTLARDPWNAPWEQIDPKGNQATSASPGHTEILTREISRQEASRLEPAKLQVDAAGPAWLYPKPQLPRFVDSLADSGVRRRALLAAQSLRAGSVHAPPQSSREILAQPRPGAVENTLQHSREQVASRWFALKGIFSKTDREPATEKQLTRETQRDTPFLVVYSLAGGVGKTSLVATLGRVLSSLNEKVLLTDTTAQGLLPFYFGASEFHAGVVRTFLPPAGSADAPIHLVSYDFASRESPVTNTENETPSEALDDLIANSQRAHRVLMDLNSSCGWMIGRMAWMKPTILIPLAADMNSVISLKTVEKTFIGIRDAEGRALQPVYLLNHFDASLPLHLDVREVLKQQLGERLLPFVIRRAAAVSEALAEGMTVVDYEPESEVARDYMGVANWLRNASAPVTVASRSLRWSER